MMSIAEQFADFTTGLRFEDLPPAVVKQTQLLLLDWLGSVLSGADEPCTLAALQVAEDFRGSAEATLLPDMSRNSCLMAALVNGVSSHALEMDDVHRKGIYHPGGPVFSALLPIAEKYGLPGARFITAAVAGYEIGIRSAEAVGQSHYQYWHTTGTCGTFGAAAAAARLLDLDKKQTVWALGSAGTQAAGLWEFLADSSMSKQLHPAKAAVDGITAAFLARRGFSGPKTIYEGEKGFFRATSTDSAPSLALSRLGKGGFKVSETSLKKHASCGHTHSAVDAMLEIVRDHQLSAGDIAEIKVEMYEQAIDLLGKVEPSSPFLAKFSIPFCLATAVLHGKVDLAAFSAPRLSDPVILALMQRISLHRSAELTKRFPDKFGCVVSVKTRSGEVFSRSVEDPLGTPENPLSQDEIIGKFGAMAAARLNGRSDALVERVLRLEKLDSMNELLSA